MEFVEGDFGMAIFGIPDGLNSPGNVGCAKSPDLIRSYLYGMRKHSSSKGILDLGNVLGNSVKDRYWAVKETVEALVETGIPVLVLGGGQDYSIPIYNALIQNNPNVRLCVVDATIDHVEEKENLTSQNFFGTLLNSYGSSLGPLSFLGIQKYYVGDGAAEILEHPETECLRLGDLRGDAIIEAEPLLRDTHFVSFDSMCMKCSDMPGQTMAMPNGFSSNEACQLAWYAGISDLNQIMGLFEINPDKDDSGVSVALAAQMGWFYIEGIFSRYGDYPERDINSYSVYNLDREEYGLPIRFFHNAVNGRWWVEFESGKGKIVKPCSERDYRMATESEIPDKWWKKIIVKED
ncbi:MAG: arginase family protein [Breznakibacter sp.]